jgi:ferredoxin
VTRVLVDRERCVGSGTCEALAPDLCEVGDDGIVEVLAGPDAGSHDPAARDAVHACPTGALSLSD